jgi:SAM-dependent methyltransferase
MLLDPIRIAAETSTADAFEHALLDALDRSLGFDAAFFTTPTGAPVTRTIDAARLTRAIAERRYEHEIAPLKRTALASRGVVIDTEVFGERAVLERRYHREFARAIGGRHTLLAFPTLRGSPAGLLMLGRSGAFRARERRLVEALLPRLAIARASFAAAHAPIAMPALPRSRTLFGRDRRVLARANLDDGEVIVRDRAGHREMVAVRGGREIVWTRARLDDPSRSGWPYIDLFHLAAARAERRDRALFIGCGGGVAIRQFARTYPGIRIDLVERSPQVIDLARRHFMLDAIPHLAVHADDGARFLRAAIARWDVIAIDAYDQELPPAFASEELFADLRRALVPGGAFAFNAIGALSGESLVLTLLERARARFDDVRLVPVLDRDERYSAHADRNVVLVGG